MIDIPLNKALAAAEAGEEAACGKCAVKRNCSGLACIPEHRKDGKNVIFKFVDLPEEANNAGD